MFVYLAFGDRTAQTSLGQNLLDFHLNPNKKGTHEIMKIMGVLDILIII